MSGRERCDCVDLGARANSDGDESNDDRLVFRTGLTVTQRTATSTRTDSLQTLNECTHPWCTAHR